MSNTVDIEQLQQDVTYRLDSAEAFALVPVKSLRKLVITSELDADLITMTPKVLPDGSPGTRIGAGLVVGMPTLEVPEPNVPGPMLDVVVPIRVMENPTINQDATNGTQLTAEEIAINVLRDLHQVGFEGFETLYAARKAVVPYVGEDIAGKLAYDVSLKAKVPMTALPSVNLPTIASVQVLQTYEITLTDTTGGATIYYTTDGSYPGSKNPTAILYAGMFAVPIVPGTSTPVRWTAYKTAMRGSDVGKITIT